MLKEATQGTWRTLELLPRPTMAIQVPFRGGAATPVGKIWSQQDADLIVAAVNALPALLAAAEVVREMITPHPADPDVSRLEAIAQCIDAYDKRTGWTAETEMQDDLRRWEALIRALAASLAGETPE